MSWGAVIVGGAALAGSVLASQSQSSAASSAASAAQSGANTQAAVQQYMFDQAMAQQRPYNLAGLYGLQQLLGGGQLGSMVIDPTYNQNDVATAMAKLPLSQQVNLGSYSFSNGQPMVDPTTGRPIAVRGGDTSTPKTNVSRGASPDQEVLEGTSATEQAMGTLTPQSSATPYAGNALSYTLLPSGSTLPSAATGTGVPDFTGGASDYMSMLAALPNDNLPYVPNLPTLSLPTAPGQDSLNLPDIPNLPSLNLDQFDYQFSEDDPGYQFRQQQLEKQINQAAAARGNYNSRAAINALSEGNMALTADEIDRQLQRQKDIYGIRQNTTLTQYDADTQRLMNLYGMGYQQATDLYGAGQDAFTNNMLTATTQYGADTQRAQDLYGMAYNRASDVYNRDYSKLQDLYNMSSALGSQKYNQLLDLVKIGQGAANSAGNAAITTGQGLSSVYGNLAAAQQNAAYAGGQAQSDLWSGIGALPANVMMLQNLYGNTGASTTSPITSNSWTISPTWQYPAYGL